VASIAGVHRPRRRPERRGPAIRLLVATVGAGLVATSAGLTMAAPGTPAAAAGTRELPRDRAPAGPVLAALPASPKLPTRKGLTAALRHLVRAKPLGKQVAVAVGDPRTGTMLYGWHAGTPFMPASTTKLLTVTAALSVLGPSHTFSTRVVDGGLRATGKPARTPGARTTTSGKQPQMLPSVILVGGGDPLLSSRAGLARDHSFDRDVYPPDSRRATIDTLASRTAKALQGKGVHRITLRYDNSLFDQPVSPHWPSEYVATSVVSPVSALWVDEGRLRTPYITRAADPAADAASRFARALRADGIEVVGKPGSAHARPSATELARVTSPPLRSIAEHVLLVSDNDGAEVLARQVALATNRRPDFAGAAAAVEARLARLGVDLRGVRLHDGSGLSRDDRIPARTLLDVLALPFTPGHSRLASLLTDLPVGGFAGSLSHRYVYTSAAAAGYVRAKTGTLTGVSSLAGTVQTRAGAVLTFVILTDRLTEYALPAIDRIAARVAACGCGS